jgi:glycosyltransferase involved in cell wall biosynthesis
VTGVTVSVLVPVFNGEAYLARSIESVLDQSYPDFELLILDDGSSDSTPAIAARYAARDPRVRVLRHDNRGVGQTLNRGLLEARGGYIAELGSDDLALPGRLEKQVDFLNRNPEHVAVGAYLRIIDSLDRPIGIREYPSTDEQLRRCLPLFNPFGSPALMYRRTAAIAAGSYNHRFKTSEDYDFLLRMARFGKVANIAEPLTAYRFHEGSTKSTRTIAQLRDTVRIKRVAFSEYGYRATPLARAVNTAQDALSHLPAGIAYWLFTKLFIRAERAG